MRVYKITEDETTKIKRVAIEEIDTFSLDDLLAAGWADFDKLKVDDSKFNLYKVDNGGNIIPDTDIKKMTSYNLNIYKSLMLQEYNTELDSINDEYLSERNDKMGDVMSPGYTDSPMWPIQEEQARLFKKDEARYKKDFDDKKDVPNLDFIFILARNRSMAIETLVSRILYKTNLFKTIAADMGIRQKKVDDLKIKYKDYLKGD